MELQDICRSAGGVVLSGELNCGFDSDDDEDYEPDSSSSESANENLNNSSDDNISLSSSSDSETDMADPDTVTVAESYISMEEHPPSDTDDESVDADTPEPIFTFKLCGDNLDKTVKRRYMRSDMSNLSLHYFHSCAILDRIDVSGLSDVLFPTCLPSPRTIASSFLPSLADDNALQQSFSVLVSRVLATHFDFFSYSCNDVVQWHISHEFSVQMSKKSVVVS